MTTLERAREIAELYIQEAGYCIDDADDDICTCLYCKCERFLEDTETL